MLQVLQRLPRQRGRWVCLGEGVRLWARPTGAVNHRRYLLLSILLRLQRRPVFRDLARYTLTRMLDLLQGERGARVLAGGTGGRGGGKI